MYFPNISLRYIVVYTYVDSILNLFQVCNKREQLQSVQTQFFTASIMTRNVILNVLGLISICNLAFASGVEHLPTIDLGYEIYQASYFNVSDDTPFPITSYSIISHCTGRKRVDFIISATSATRHHQLGTNDFVHLNLLTQTVLLSKMVQLEEYAHKPIPNGLLSKTRSCQITYRAFPSIVQQTCPAIHIFLHQWTLEPQKIVCF